MFYKTKKNDVFSASLSASMYSYSYNMYTELWSVYLSATEFCACLTQPVAITIIKKTYSYMWLCESYVAIYS